MGVGHKDLGRLHGHGRRLLLWSGGSREDGVEATLYRDDAAAADGSQLARLACVPNANLDFVIFESRDQVACSLANTVSP